MKISARTLFFCLVFGLLMAGPAGGVASAAGEITLSTVSSRPDMITGGDSLVQVGIPPAAKLDRLRIMAPEGDVTDLFQPVGGDPLTRQALLQGLGLGAAVTASAPGFSQARLQLVDHSVNGPILSGPRQTPFYCQTPGPTIDVDDCSAATTVSYRYRPASGGGWVSTDQVASIPAANLLKTTETAATGDRSARLTVPMLIRVEQGTINRANYRIGFLVDPGNPDQPSPSAYNGRLVYNFGGGCHGGFVQGSLGGLNNYLPMKEILAGYAGAGSTQNAFGVRCSDSVSAETVSMVKEHFAETWGPPDFTIGKGSSGGAMAQQMIDNNFPGLLDGSVISNSFPDNAFAGNSLIDCRLINEFLASPRAAGWSPDQRRAVFGTHRETACGVVYGAFGAGFFDPGGSCPSLMPAGLVFDPVSNPGGVRCSVFDGNVNVYGIDPATGLVRRPVDNVGVQYGLRQVRDGTISVDQFLDLNAGIGGINAFNGDSVPERSATTPETLKRVYESGLVNTAGAGLASTPVIDNRRHQIENEVNAHQTIHALSMRQRLLQANGDPDGDGSAGTQVIWTSDRGLDISIPILTMDRWITAIEADSSGKSRRRKVLDDRPGSVPGSPAAKDACFSNASGTLISQETITAHSGVCGSSFPSYSLPRMEAGLPLANDMIKCRLKPVDPGQYGVSLSVVQAARLESIFPHGTCDNSVPGDGFEISRKVWRALPGPAVKDSGPPDTAIASGPKRLGQSRRLNFDFTSTKTGSSFECRFDRTPFRACVTPFQRQKMSVGAHTFEVRSTDIYGNTDAYPAKTYFVVGHPKAKTLIRSRRARVNRRGKAWLSVRCYLRGMKVCAGRVKVRVRGRRLGLRGRKARKMIVVSKRGYRIRKGRRHLRIRLRRKARRVIKRHGRLRASIKVTANRTGAKPVIRYRAVQLRTRH